MLYLNVLRSAAIEIVVERSSDSDTVVRTGEWELFLNSQSFVGVLCCSLLKLLLLERITWLLKQQNPGIQNFMMRMISVLWC